MKRQLIATALCALAALPAGALAQSAGGDESAPLHKHNLHVTIRAPEPDKWAVQNSADGSRRIFKCKPLACSEPQTVTFAFRKSPVRNPDPKALERFAKVDLPKSIRALGAAREVMTNGAEKIETLRSEPVTLKGYPSVSNETKLSRGASVIYVNIAIIFAGPLMVRVQSISPNQELAQQALDQFVEAMQIEERQPPAGPKPAGPGKTRDL